MLRGVTGRERYGLKELTLPQKDAVRTCTLIAVRAAEIAKHAVEIVIPLYIQTDALTPSQPSPLRLDEFQCILTRADVKHFINGNISRISHGLKLKLFEQNKVGKQFGTKMALHYVFDQIIAATTAGPKEDEVIKMDNIPDEIPEVITKDTERIHFSQRLKGEAEDTDRETANKLAIGG